MAFTIAELRGTLGLDTSNFVSGILSAEAATEVFGQKFSTLIANPVLGSLQILKGFGSSVIARGQEVLGLAENIERLSQVTSLSGDVLQALALKAEQAGYGLALGEQAARAYTTRVGQAAQGTGPLVQLLDRLNISAQELGRGDETLFRFLDAIAQVPDEAQRAALAAAVFGEEAGPKLLNVVGGGSDALRGLIDDYRRLGLVLDQDAVSKLAAFNTTLGFTQQAIDGVVQNAVVEFLRGFIGVVGTADDGVVGLAENLSSRLGPAARSLGEDVGALVGNLDELIDRVNRAVDFVDRFTQGRAFEEQNGIVQSIADFLTPYAYGQSNWARDHFGQSVRNGQLSRSLY